MIFHSLSMINRNITKYEEAVQQYNYLRLNQTLLIAMFFLFCVMAMGLFSTSMRMSIPGYMSAFAVFFSHTENFLQRIHAEICSGGLVSALSFRIRTGSLSESVPVSRTSGGDYADGALYYSSFIYRQTLPVYSCLFRIVSAEYLFLVCC